MWVFSHIIKRDRFFEIVLNGDNMASKSLSGSKCPAPRAQKASSAKPAVKTIRTRRGLPPVSIEDLALMLEIDLALGRRRDFRSRLQKALNAVASAPLRARHLPFA
jgi:hypothetical protein